MIRLPIVRGVVVSTAVAILLSAFVGLPATASPVSINVSGAFTNATGTLSGLLGLGFTSGFNYDTDTANGIPGSLAFEEPVGGGQKLGVEYASGSATPSIPALPAGYVSPTSVAEIDNDVFFTSSELRGILPAGVYDLFTVNGWEPGSTFGTAGSTINEGDPIDAVNFGLTFVGDLFAGALTAGSDMPGTLNLAGIIGVVVTVEEYAGGELVGLAYQFGQIDGAFNEFAIVSDTPAVPAPAAMWLFVAGLAGLATLRRRRSA
jgi:hypothetical protein